MIRRLLAIAGAAGVLLVPAAAGGAAKTVDVADDFFDPATLKVKKDTRVSFDWIGTNDHDVAKAKGPGPFFSSGPFDTQGVNFKHKFEKKGTYKIICTLHEGMKMKIEVN